MGTRSAADDFAAEVTGIYRAVAKMAESESGSLTQYRLMGQLVRLPRGRRNKTPKIDKKPKRRSKSQRQPGCTRVLQGPSRAARL